MLIHAASFVFGIQHCFMRLGASCLAATFASPHLSSMSINTSSRCSGKLAWALLDS